MQLPLTSYKPLSMNGSKYNKEIIMLKWIYSLFGYDMEKVYAVGILLAIWLVQYFLLGGSVFQEW